MNCLHPQRVSSIKRVVILVFFATATTLASSAQMTFVVSGQVHDQTGAAVAGADVRFHSEHYSASTRTGQDGRFTFSGVPDRSGALTVAAPGFAGAEREWMATASPLVVVLPPAAASERIVVSATRTAMKLSELPGSAVLLSSPDLEANPAVTMDDVLRQVPGFSLFRRSSSRVANPTSQGVSLRGVGPSGPSRALVLEDGVPIVDPFGGWVYWDRIPRAELASVEVFRGGASNLYGSNALGGVIQFLSKTPTRPSASVDLSYGSENTPDLSAWGGTNIAGWDISSAVDMSRTDGYILVPSFQRGAVDAAADSRHATIDGSIAHAVGQNGTAFLRGTFFDESRNNGTPLTLNSTATGFGSAGVNSGIGAHDRLSARIYGQAQGYDQTFSSVASDRNSEQLTNIQHVPSQEIGTSLQWNHLLGPQTLIAGIDTQNVMGASEEEILSTSTYKVSGGRQRSIGILGEDIIRAGKWTLIAGARWDDWKNGHGSITSFPSSSAPTSTLFPDRSETAFSPRLSILRALSRNLSVSLSGYRAFRAPTLNELYRSFRQGNSITQNNAFLGPERLTGAEAGLRDLAFDGRLEARATVFWADIVDPVTNVTTNVTPTLITRQRQNLGRTRSIGTELDGILRISRRFQFSAGYQYTHATVVDSVPALVGLDVPEVPRHQFSWEARYWNLTQIMLSVQGRYSGAQFDDDLNTFGLGSFYVMDLFAGRQFSHGVTAYIAAENLLNERYAVALSAPTDNPLRNLGPPILARIGLRFDFPARQ
jgi:outer membrane receptor protein involved in Fe transport